MSEYYDELEEVLRTGFETAALLKETPRGSIALVRHRESGTRYLLRRFEGSGEVYRKLLRIRCAALPQIVEVAEKEGHTLVLEEYVAGDRLDTLLECGTLSARQTRAIARQVCAALYALHALGAVHRDVKPENILLRGDAAVLIDFDASRLHKRERAADTVVLGTLGYAAPEQYGFSQTDGRADIYSLGVTMNVMRTGRHPSQELAGGRLGRIIRRCTELSPERRYQTVRDLMEAL